MKAARWCVGEGSWFEFRLGLFCVEFACSPCVVWGTPASLHRPKTYMLGKLVTLNTLGVSVRVSVHGCLSLCGPVMDWRRVQGIPCLSPNDSWDSHQHQPTHLSDTLLA